MERMTPAIITETAASPIRPNHTPSNNDTAWTPLSPTSPIGPYSNAHPNLFAYAASSGHGHHTLVEDNETFSDEDEDDDDSDEDDDPFANFSAANLLSIMANIQRPCTVLMGEGYSNIHKLCETPQGAIYSAIKDHETFRIKQTKKEMHCRHESRPDTDGMRVLVGDDILKETVLLHTLTSSAPSSPHTVEYVDFVESESDYYLIMRAVGDCTLTDFITKAHRLIRDEKLELENYKQAFRRLVKQIATGLAWLHDEQHVCHMNLSPDNILIAGEPFEAVPKGWHGSSSGSVRVSEEISIRFSDFGLSEQFGTGSSFRCTSYWLRDGYECTSPRAFEEVAYDARKADMFALGAIIYKMATDTFLCRLPDESDMGFYVLARNKLDAYIRISGLRKYFDTDIHALMMRLLCVDEAKRCSAKEALQSEMWRH